MQKKICRSARGNIVYWISRLEKEAKTLVFLHGLTANHTLFTEQIHYLKAQYHVLVWDAPMHGESRPYTSFSYDHAADDLYAILQKEHIKEVYLIGQSMGGYVAQSFIAKWPKFVSGLIAIDSSPYGLQYYSKLDRWWLKQIGWMSNLIPDRWLKKSIAIVSAVTDDGRKNMLDSVSIYTKKELVSLLDVGYKSFLEANTNITINCPVLLLVGERDHVGKVKQYNKQWTEHTGYPLIVIKQAGHNANFDAPAEVNTHIQKFIEGSNKL